MLIYWELQYSNGHYQTKIFNIHKQLNIYTGKKNNILCVYVCVFEY